MTNTMLEMKLDNFFKMLSGTPRTLLHERKDVQGLASRGNPCQVTGEPNIKLCRTAEFCVRRSLLQLLLENQPVAKEPIKNPNDMQKEGRLRRLLSRLLPRLAVAKSLIGA
jgi:hypothetical protein